MDMGNDSIILMCKKYNLFIFLLVLVYYISFCSSIQTQNFYNDGWYGRGCPPRATGQFPYLGDCKRFYNCYNGRGQLSICAPGTLFNPSTLECDFPSKVTCLKDGGMVSSGNEEPNNHRHHYHHHHHHQNWYHQNRQHPSNPSHYKAVEKSAKGYHAGVQPPGMLPSIHLQPPPSPQFPVNNYNPVYSSPALPAQHIPDQRGYVQGGFPEAFPNNEQYPSYQQKVPYEPPHHNQYPQGQYSSGVQNTPSSLPTYNQYQPGIQKQLFQTKSSSYDGSSLSFPGYIPVQPLPSYPQNPPDVNIGLKPIVFPDNSKTDVNDGQNYQGQGFNSYYKPDPIKPAVFSPPVPLNTFNTTYSFPSYPGVVPDSNQPVSEFNPRGYYTTEQPSVSKNLCPEGFSGLAAHTDCKKFLSCSHGRTFVMDCSPGTRFNPDLMICDHPHHVQCNGDNVNSREFHEDHLQPAETNQEENIYHSTTTVSYRFDQVPETEPVENRNKELTEDNVTEQSVVSVVTEQSVKTLKIIPKIKIESSFKDAIKIENQSNITGSKQSFKPENTPPIKARLLTKRNSTLDKQILRLRGSPSQFEGFVEMQLSTGSWGVVCDKRNDWKIEEAHVVCKSLGYPRGAELSWQGLPANVKNSSSNILATDTISCTGSEDSLLDCTFSVGDGCDINKDGVWVRCYSHGLSRCYPGEMSLGDQCYSLVVPSEDSPTENLVGFTQGEALAHCQKKGGHLVDITSQVENDFVSEWLIRQSVEGNIMTSGVGMSLMGGSIWIWEGSENTFTYHNWWAGWESGKSIPPQTYTGRALCIVLKRYFPCKDSKGTEERLCDAQYYYWDVEDCDAMPTSLPYVCERPANKIGCVVGTGASYKGAANVTRAGDICLPWDHKEVLQELKYRISEADRKVSLSGHNFCRNIAGKETHPWCFVRETPTLIKKELCDIPICSEGLEKSARYFQCPLNYFACGISGKCLQMSKVCDGNSDCPGSEDESNCQGNLSQFTSVENSKLIVPDVEVFIRTPLSSCAQRCLELINCRSFSFLVDQEECVLSETNVGLSGNLSQASGWNYYEVKSKSINCKNSFVCDNGKCIAKETVCNGRNDCGDRSDERNCSWLKQKIQIKLSGGNKPNEGTIEVKAHDKWGLVCDDEFELQDGDVVCRHLGYPLGAAEIKKHSHFNVNRSMNFIIDNLNCIGNETSIADCFHNGWGIHDCQEEEAAGVVCKVAKSECSFNYWQCERSTECIPLAFLCDNVKDCKDHTDEDPERCKSPIQVRLVGTGGVSRSNKANEGRVEIRRFGVWGTVCDDDFGVNEAKVVCGALGYNGSAQVYKEAAYGAGEGIIWLDQVHCSGNESNIHQCLSDGWGQTNCKHNEDVAVACSAHPMNEEETKKKPISKQKLPHENTIESEEDDLLLEDIFIPDCGTVMGVLANTNHGATAKVVAGFETIKGTYPWQASIRVKGIAGKSTHWCGAVVISRFHVLTAGHCLRDYAKSAYFIRAGDYDNEVDEGTEQDMEIDEMWIHSGFDKEVKLNNDIALVKVKGEGFEFDTWVLPACLPRNNPITPSNCTISGWGSSANPGTGFARTLHATWLKPFSFEECQTIEVYKNSLRPGMMCAGSLDGGPDSCQGDSGGPLLCPVGNQYTLFGITSWGHGCGRSNSPGVYTNVPYYTKWINDRIKLSMKKQKYKKSSI